ncbi:Ribosomal protein S6 modification protein [Candidatus Jidaibacter acanthamoeba]|uniref:Probable alpha-L-glutamate ligase n=1 Tax=Candidatus Jidaibacter acanthamoebae TaxID=86105 RepID=A0A0C1QY30_9RICK|nr:30S ribosomal protein S6--L-glutamate ligase [Candidatus Jidaibacter acanthamoeba]KIE04945.1 Ribosomal protein S6 modification protein [Candidatus Jidaibacter acanthamoeba]
MTEKFIIGSEEWCSLPELGLPAVKIRVDSGAKTSALHAFNIHCYDEGGKAYAKFDVHPIQNNRKIIHRCIAPVVDRRVVRSSNGEVEKRVVVVTPIKLGDQVWDIEITLTNRDSMGYRMLLGREAMQNKVLVDPDAVFIVSDISGKEARNLYKLHVSKKASLNIVLLASDPDLYSNRRIMEAGELRGHNMKFINVRHCYMNISANEPTVCYRGGEILKSIDAVIPRLRPSTTFYGCAVTRQFQASGAFSLNEAVAITRSRDKLRSLQMLADKGINMPITGFANSPEDTKHLIKTVGGAPLIVKLLEGTQGVGVVLAETNKAAESVINAFKSLKVNILVQEYIKEAKGKDIRCFVIDGKVVGAMQRVAADDEFRANLHLGGVAAPVKLTPEEKKMAISAAKILGLKVAGVDIIRSDTGPKVLEVNSSPGLEGIESVSGEDIAGSMIESIERHVLGKE